MNLVDLVGPSGKRVKVSSIKSALESRVSRKHDHKTFSTLIQDTFPNTERRPLSHERVTHGRIRKGSSRGTHTEEQLKARIRELEQIVRDLRSQW